MRTGARENQACLVHISTDYVFGFASKNESAPYSESDQVSPSGIYGLSKYAGEMAVREILSDSSLCIRTSWLHAAKRSNFVETMLRLAEERDELAVVDDQIGSPTYVPDLAEAILLLTENSARGFITSAVELRSPGMILRRKYSGRPILRSGLRRSQAKRCSDLHHDQPTQRFRLKS